MHHFFLGWIWTYLNFIKNSNLAIDVFDFKIYGHAIDRSTFMQIIIFWKIHALRYKSFKMNQFLIYELFLFWYLFTKELVLCLWEKNTVYFEGLVHWCTNVQKMFKNEKVYPGGNWNIFGNKCNHGWNMRKRTDLSFLSAWIKISTEVCGFP
jgi:hypothetical protein